jgi:two-component system CheB/CheR fusion protein
MSAASRIVGVGASAGGLESLEQLFSALPSDTGMAFVVIQHLSPDFRSLMDELIARHSDMPVKVVEDGTEVEANHIYLLPPRKEMIMRERRLMLTEKPHGLSLPIDLFFRSLAQDAGPDAVAVVLSGSGSDGSRGVIDIKRAGGLVMCESPATAKFDGMPMSAQATGVVDHTASPRDIGRILVGLPPLDIIPDEDAEPLSTEPAMDSLLRQLRDAFGIDFSLYKTTTVTRRIQRRIDLQRIPNVAQYVEQVKADPAELNALYQDLLIGVTQFFRDVEAFDLLERDIIPQLIDQVPPEQEIRVWCAGCGTGEEPYSIAMLFHEALKARNRAINLKIIATDVHPSSLEAASIGIYGEQQLANVSPARRERFFNRRATGYQISQDLRQLLVFARHNVTKDAPFTKMHLITCRNMLIYLQPQAQRTVLSLFHFGLASGGVLFLGASESPGTLTDEFIAIDEHWKIFRKRRDRPLFDQLRLPMGSPMRRPAVEVTRPQGADPLILATYDQLLDRFMPASLLVDEQRNLIDTFGGAERLLHVRKRRPTNNVLDMLDGDVRTVIAAAIQRALKDGAAVAFSNIKVHDGDGEKRSTITAEPFVHPRTGARHVLVTFADMPSPAAEAADAVEPVREELPPQRAASPSSRLSPILPVSLDDVSRDRMETLETELAYTRETLQATIEELETSNEEMQATNEELVASNEELQSTNEELHSVNEELYTVNAEYQQKIAELKELNADMQHLLEGTDVGTVFLDRDLRIRRYTSRIAHVFRIQAHDIGREISDFSHNILRPSLIEDLERARREGAVIEDEVRDRSGTPYFLRILPYKVQRNGKSMEPSPIDGVVMTLTDISALESARARLAQLSAIVESSDDAIVGKALDGTITAWNRGAERLYGYSAEEAIGRNVRILMAHDSTDELPALIDRMRRGEKIEHFHSMRVRKDGSGIDVSVTMSPIYGREGQLVGISAIARDISPLIAAQRELEQRQEKIRALLESTAEAARRREQFLAMLSHELRNPLAAVLSATKLVSTKPAPEIAQRCIAVMERQGRHMARLLDDLLDVSRITRGKFELRLGELDLCAVVEAAVESTSPLLADRGIKLDVTLPKQPVYVKGDAARLQQVVANLLSNAATYSPTGTRVELQLAVQNHQALLRVVDRGMGIDHNMIGKIFELFVQAEQRLDRPRGGLGVGLSLARSIVELHGGKIEARSDGPNLGSEFVVKLPVIATVSRAVAEAVQARGPRRRIVLVEDQADSREMMRMLLESLDHIVIDAADGATAVELIERERPDAALIDIGLPTMSGYEVAQRIRQRKELADIVLVALTGYGAPNDISAAKEAGFDAHLIKPADLSRLQELLANTKSDRMTD